MSKTICSTIRRQLDDMRLDEPQGLDVSRHLNECRECREFHEKQSKLRLIVASLGTVSAPPDFDFRLRSRLARDNSNGSYQPTRSFWQRTTAVAAAAIIIIGGVVFLIRELPNRNPTIQSASVTKNPSKAPEVVASTPPQEKQASKSGDEKAGLTEEKGKVPKKNLPAPLRNNRLLVSEAQASSRATVVRAPQQMAEPVFPIDLSQQSLRVSLFDGRGNPRTISLPTVTFGSQRVVPTTTSFAPKGVW